MTIPFSSGCSELGLFEPSHYPERHVALPMVLSEVTIRSFRLDRYLAKVIAWMLLRK